MHAYPAALIGALVWIGLVAEATDKAIAVATAPLVVSGVMLALCVAPAILSAGWRALNQKPAVQ